MATASSFYTESLDPQGIALPGRESNQPVEAKLGVRDDSGVFLKVQKAKEESIGSSPPQHQTLPPEIWHQIFQHTEQFSRNEQIQLMMVSTWVYSEMLPIVYRDITIRRPQQYQCLFGLEPEDAELLIKYPAKFERHYHLQWARRRDALSHIITLSIRCPPPPQFIIFDQFVNHWEDNFDAQNRIYGCSFLEAPTRRIIYTSPLSRLESFTITTSSCTGSSLETYLLSTGIKEELVNNIPLAKMVSNIRHFAVVRDDPFSFSARNPPPVSFYTSSADNHYMRRWTNLETFKSIGGVFKYKTNPNRHYQDEVEEDEELGQLVEDEEIEYWPVIPINKLPKLSFIEIECRPSDWEPSIFNFLHELADYGRCEHVNEVRLMSTSPWPVRNGRPILQRRRNKLVTLMASGSGIEASDLVKGLLKLKFLDFVERV